jgi:hypothetical protein
MEEKQYYYGDNSIVTLQECVKKSSSLLIFHCPFRALHSRQNFISFGMDLAVEDGSVGMKQRNVKYGQLVGF